MEILKRILIAVTSIVLIGLVVYVIHISQVAQEQRQGIVKVAPEEMPPDTTTRPPGIDTLAPITPDTSRPQVHREHTIPDSIRWQRMPKTSEISKTSPPGNPNPFFIAAANKILPAVVTIENERLVGGVPDDETHRFFREKQGKENEQIPRPGYGSGIIISPDGFILTNEHVVENATKLKVILYDKREFPAEFIGGDPNTDIALLKIETSDLPSAFMGNSDSVKIGEWVMAVGSPLNFTSTITAGIVSALGRDIRIIRERFRVENFIQTDAVINPGNSGGALINLDGEVIGINTAIATRTGLYQGYGFAIPSNLAVRIVNDILKFGEVRRGLLGVTIAEVDNKVAKGVGLPQPTGVLVQGLEPGYPAEKAGIKAGDIILGVDGQEIVSVNDLQSKIASRHPGEVVTLKIWRNKAKYQFQVKLGKAPVRNPTDPTKLKSERIKYKNLGIVFRDLSSREKQLFKTDHGIFVKDVQLGSPGDKSGIFGKEVIVSLNDQPVKNALDFQVKIQQLKSGDVAKLLVRRRQFDDEYTERIVFVEQE